MPQKRNTFFDGENPLNIYLLTKFKIIVYTLFYFGAELAKPAWL